MVDREEACALSPSLFDAADRAEWIPVTAGESAASVFRSAEGDRFAKCVPAEGVGALEDERDRVAWISGQGVPGPRALDWRTSGDGACLITSAVIGVPADAVSAKDLQRAWSSISDAVRRLHELPPSACPFSRNLDTMFAVAADVVASDAVNPDFLPADQRHAPAAALLNLLVREVPQRREQEATDTVVCHGDLCLPNIILDPRTLDVTGFIDLGRLGLADRYADLALLLANARETWADEDQAEAADRALAVRYGIDLDHERLRFYLRLDPLTWG